MSAVDRVLARAKRVDRWMTWVITAGGLAIIAAVLGMLVVIAHEAWPLFASPKVRALQGQRLAPAQHLVVEESGLAFLALDPAAGIRVHRADRAEPMALLESGPARPWKMLSAPTARGEFVVLGADGQMALGKTSWEKPGGEPDPSAWTAQVAWLASHPCPEAPDKILSARLMETGGLEGGASLRVIARRGQTLVWADGPSDPKAPLAWKPLTLPEGQPTAALLTPNGRRAYVGTEEGRIFLLELGDAPALVASTTFSQPVSALGFVLGQTTLLVGGRQGAMMALQILNTEGRGPVLQVFHRFTPMVGAVQGFMMSLRDKRFLAWSESHLVVDYLTTEKRLLDQRSEGILHAALAPRGDHIQVLTRGGEVRHWSLHAPHPQTSWRTLWGRTHYEGYDTPSHVWQSTGGTDDFEPKLSLVPLVFGTLKGTLYAMLFALPLALLGALYTSQFASPRLRNTIKPTVEIMAALPSVVLGFLAGLVLAPLFERSFIQIFLLPVCALVVGLLAAPLWMRTSRAFRNLWGEGREVVWTIPVLLLGLALSFAVAPWFERVFLAGDFRQWLLDSKGMIYDQRNALVVGFAMGFAVIPIIFTISEDALSSVPRSLTSASLACGASPWQTAWRVVLPTASPGIFSATMVGFGRAIGETMIVLMATGNTPILDWGPFNGMRTMSATIAVEAPEAPEGGTLFRVLFLTALLLFALTFLLNTLAELIRQHLRKRYETF